MAENDLKGFSLQREEIRPYNPTPVVQVIPWVHHENSQAHEAIVKFLKEVPKNSVLFIEESAFGLDFLSGLPQLVKRGKFNGYYFGESRLVARKLEKYFRTHSIYDYLSNMAALSGMEVIEEARRRNLVLLPLDTSTSRISISRAFSLTGGDNPNSRLNFVIDNYARDAVFAKQIEKKFSSLVGRKVFALCGTAHVPGLIEELSNRGISSHLVARIFSAPLKRELFEKIRIANRGRRLYLNKNYEALRVLVPKLLADTRLWVQKDRFVEIKKRINEGNFRNWAGRHKRKLERKKLRGAKKGKTR